MYINNTIDISEADLDNKYKQYFPSLTIRAKKIGDAYRARFISIENGVEKEEAVYRYEKTENDIVIEPLSITQVTPPIHYDCVGWSLTPNGEIIKDFSIFKFDENNTEYVFYAVFKLHSYQIEYINPGANIQDVYNESMSIEYGQKVSEPSKIPTRNFENNQIIELEDRIAFKGWTLQEE
jgi:hypothetical protein